MTQRYDVTVSFQINFKYTTLTKYTFYLLARPDLIWKAKKKKKKVGGAGVDKELLHPKAIVIQFPVTLLAFLNLSVSFFLLLLWIFQGNTQCSVILKSRSLSRIREEEEMYWLSNLFYFFSLANYLYSREWILRQDPGTRLKEKHFRVNISLGHCLGLSWWCQLLELNIQRGFVLSLS